MQHEIIIQVRMRPCFLPSSSSHVGYMRISIWAREILHIPKPCSTAARNWGICIDGSLVARLISSYEILFLFLFFFSLSLPVSSPCLAVLGLECSFHVFASAFDGFNTLNDILTTPTAAHRSFINCIDATHR